MKKIQTLIGFILVFPLMGMLVSANEMVANRFMALTNQGDTFFQQGHFQPAAEAWEQSLALVDDCTVNASACIDVLRRLAAAYQAMRVHSRVLPTLEQAWLLAEQTSDLKRSVLVRTQLSDAWLAMRQANPMGMSTVAVKSNDLDKSKEFLNWKTVCALACSSVIDAKVVKAPMVLARALNNYGNILTVLQNHFLTTSSNTAVLSALEACLISPSIQETQTQNSLSTFGGLLHTRTACEWEQILIEKNDKSFAVALQKLSMAYQNYQFYENADDESTQKFYAAIKRLKKNGIEVIEALPKVSLGAYAKSIQLAKQAGDTKLALKAAINRLKVSLLSETPLDEIVIGFNEVWTQFNTMPDHYHKMRNLLSMGLLALQIWQENKLLEKELAKFVADNPSIKLEKQPATLTQANQHQLMEQAYAAFQKVTQIAHHLQDKQMLSMAYGYWAQLYEQAQRYEEALTLTRRAIFFANQAHVPVTKASQDQEEVPLTGHFSHSLYEWYWQQGRIFKQQGQLDQAIASYQLASHNLKPIQKILEVGYRLPIGLFDQVVKPVHYGYADLLLQKAMKSNYSKKQELFRQAIEAVERVKIAELQNYFDECVLALHAKTSNLLDLNRTSQLGFDPEWLQKTALLYPILLEDKLVMLVKILDQNDIHYYETVDEEFNETVFNETVYEFRLYLQKRSHNRFLDKAQILYQWLIDPIESLLTRYQVDTLIVVPDGALRMIPLATLHDGQQFLIEKYAMALTPGLTLVDPKPSRWNDSKILLAGLSDAVQGHSPLKNIPQELVKLQCLTTGTADQNLVSLLNQEFATQFSLQWCRDNAITTKRMNNQLIFNKSFSVPNFEAQVEKNKYTIVHLATHGEFDADPEYTYLLTYDDKMKMDKLENIIGLGRFRHETPLELLTLSACKTAVGNERAALGLAGIAVKAGSRSALATLWYVDDEATSDAISEFYQYLLKNPKLPKAKALQKAQKELLAQKYYWHPGYWGPFLLIGNWL